MVPSFKVVFDSNIYISAIIFDGKAKESIDLALKFCQIIISVPMIDEITDVLKNKFNVPENKIKEFTDFLIENCVIVDIAGNLENVCKDPDDNKIIETAFLSGAEYLVSGDNYLLEVKNYHNTKIVSLKYFLDIVKKNT